MANSVVENITCQCGTQLTVQHEGSPISVTMMSDGYPIRCPVSSHKHIFPGKVLVFRYKPVAGGWIEGSSKFIEKC